MEMKAHCDEGGGRMLLGDNTRRGCGHVASDHVSVCWSVDFNWTGLHTYIFEHTNTQILLVPDFRTLGECLYMEIGSAKWWIVSELIYERFSVRTSSGSSNRGPLL
jgi:hypothetical protein